MFYIYIYIYYIYICICVYIYLNFFNNITWIISFIFNIQYIYMYTLALVCKLWLYPIHMWSWLSMNPTMFSSLFHNKGLFSFKWWLFAINLRYICKTNISNITIKQPHNSGLTENTFFFLSVLFYKHPWFTGQQGKEESISLTPLYHCWPLHRHLDISQEITVGTSSLL